MYFIEKKHFPKMEKCTDGFQIMKVLNKLVNKDSTIDMSRLSGLKTTVWSDTYRDLKTSGKYFFVRIDYENLSITIDKG